MDKPALPDWRETPHGWYCDDLAEQAFAFRAESKGFDLPVFDRWLCALEPCPARDELIERRALAKAADPNSGHMKVALEWLHLRRFTIEREGFLLPLAQRGAKFRPGKRDNAAGPLRKLIQRLLRKPAYRGLKARELWAVCGTLPERQRAGIEFGAADAWIPGHGNVSFCRFANIISEERKAPK